MTANINDKLMRVGQRGTKTTLASPGKAPSDNAITLTNPANWETATAIAFSLYEEDPTTHKEKDGTYTVWKGIVVGSQVTSLQQLYGPTDLTYPAGSKAVMHVSAAWANMLIEALLAQHKQDGSHGDITAETAEIEGDVHVGGKLFIAGSASDGEWQPISGSISTVTHNGNRSYSLATSDDNTAHISPGFRIRAARTVPAPIQSASLNGATNYFNKSSPAGMTFTDDFVVSAWVKLSSYQQGSIVTRYNGTNGWQFRVDATGQVVLLGFNGGGANVSYIVSSQSLPLNKWVHVAAQLDMSAYTATATTSYVMIDGVDVPANVGRGGTSPTALVQAGNLEIGSTNGGSQLLSGKVAQVAIYNSKVTQANIRATISQGLSGSETSLISAYSFNNSINDLNTTSANNLTSQGSATATNADAPFGGQGDGGISSAFDYGIVAKVTASTIIVNVAEGCTIPTAGGVAALTYSSVRCPYNFPGQKRKWRVESYQQSAQFLTYTSTSVVQMESRQLAVPIGSWQVGIQGTMFSNGGGSGQNTSVALSSSPTSYSNGSLVTYSYTFTSDQKSSPLVKNELVDIAIVTDYRIVGQTTNAGVDFRLLGSNVIYADNGYL